MIEHFFRAKNEVKAPPRRHHHRVGELSTRILRDPDVWPEPEFLAGVGPEFRGGRDLRGH